MALQRMLGVALLSSTLLIGSSLATYYGHGSSSSNDACDRQFNTDCQCNCDCGDIYLPPPPPPCGNCPDKTMKKCITCSDALNNWDCDINGDATECDEANGEEYCLGEYDDITGRFSRRCAKYEECPLPILNGIMVAGELADGIGCKEATCEVYGCKAFWNPDFGTTGDLNHCSVNMNNGRQWVPVGKGLGLCGCDDWCWEFYEPKRCDCCSDFFTLCPSSGLESSMANLDEFLLKTDAELAAAGATRLMIDSFRCGQTTALKYGRFRDEHLTFINCTQINADDSACDMATHVSSLPTSVIREWRPDLLP